ncbi:hypothetical protein F4777DRAFT_94955 [Nemania sp. FL0916]|nr:hypothetical protein F4777DRAFT_94955 [Nemania sp. FL0916]
MATQNVSSPGAATLSAADGEPASVCVAGPSIHAESLAESHAETRKESDGEAVLEPGEVPAAEIKKEKVDHEGMVNPFSKYITKPSEHGAESSFAHITATPSWAAPLSKSEPRSTADDTLRPMTSIQRRNRARLTEVVTRLQHFDGSLTDLLAIASVQQQLEDAFADLDRAKNQLKEVLRHFESEGHINARQTNKKNVAVKDLARASNRITQLTKELFDLQRRQPGAS